MLLKTTVLYKYPIYNINFNTHIFILSICFQYLHYVKTIVYYMETFSANKKI